MNSLKTGLMATVAVLALNTTAFAAPLVPGGLIFPTGDTVGTAPNTAGTVQNDNLIPFAFTSPISQFLSTNGNVQNRVIESNLLNTMVFAPRIRDTFTSMFDFEIYAFSLDGYAGWNTDVGYRTDGSGDKGPTSVSRSADGDRLTFRYDDEILINAFAPGVHEESLFPYIITDASNYELTGSMTIFGYEADDHSNTFQLTLTGLAVPSAVPVPAAVWLFGSGLIGLIGIARRQKQTV